jgi:hypothetical protein
MIICILDFAVFPVLWSIIQATHSGTVSTQWDPITLKGAGLFHMAMGAIIGVAVFGRTQEKMTGTNNGGLHVPAPTAPSFGAPAPAPKTYTPPPSFGNAPLGGNTVSTAPSFGRGPNQPEHPEI